MKNLLALVLFAFSGVGYAQTGNVGINTVLPGSTLTVSGSIAGQYKNVSASTTLGVNDFYTAFSGSTAGTFTLPAATAAAPAAGNTLGRVYYIKNTGTAALTVAASGSELIDTQSGAGVASVSITPGGYIMLISKGTTTGTTWEMGILINKTTTTIAALGASDQVTYSGTNLTNFNNSIPQIIPFASPAIVNQGGSASWNDAGDYWQIIESGVYKIEGNAYFASLNNTTGTYGWTGINLNITKNGTALSNIIGGTRANIMNAIVDGGANTPINASCIVPLNAGDKVYLTMNWAFGNKPSGDAHIATPASLSENRSFSIQQLATP